MTIKLDTNILIEKLFTFHFFFPHKSTFLIRYFSLWLAKLSKLLHTCTFKFHSIKHYNNSVKLKDAMQAFDFDQTLLRGLINDDQD